MSLDNDLLTRWINAGTLDRDGVRDLILEIQDTRDDVAAERADSGEISALEDDLRELQERLDDEEEGRALAEEGRALAEEGRALAEEGRALAIAALKLVLEDERDDVDALRRAVRNATLPPV